MSDGGDSDVLDGQAYNGDENDEVYAAHGEKHEDSSATSSSEEEDFDVSASDGQFDEELEQFVLNFHKIDRDNEIGRALSYISETESPMVNAVDQIQPAEWEERKANALRSLKERLQYYTEQARSTSGDLGVLDHIEISPQSMQTEDEPLVEHKESLDSYWNEFSNALTQLDGIRLYRISIEKIQLTERTMTLLATCLRGKVHIMFFLDDNQLCREGIRLLATLLESNPTLQRLRISRNPITDMNAASCLSQSLKALAHLKLLTLTFCNLGNNVNILSVILESDVEEIDLSHNEIGNLGAPSIMNYLQTVPPMRILTLDNNMFNDDDAILFAQALKRNTNLRKLSICDNKFTHVGAKSLLRGLFDHSSLNTIAESNHTCTLNLFHLPTMQDYFASLNCDFDRETKLLIALHEEESLLRYLEDVPVELMPDVLAFLQTEQDQKKLMNMMYSTTRWWNMPSLYSYHCTPSKKRKAIE